MSSDALSRRSRRCAQGVSRHNRPQRAAVRRGLHGEIAEQAVLVLLEVMRLRPPLFSSHCEILDRVPLRIRVAYQGTRVNTPARISKAARRAATTAQLSRDNFQLLRGSDTVLVLMVFSFIVISTYGSARRVMIVRLTVPQRLADLLNLP